MLNFKANSILFVKKHHQGDHQNNRKAGWLTQWLISLPVTHWMSDIYVKKHTNTYLRAAVSQLVGDQNYPHFAFFFHWDSASEIELGNTVDTEILSKKHRICSFSWEKDEVTFSYSLIIKGTWGDHPKEGQRADLTPCDSLIEWRICVKHTNTYLRAAESRLVAYQNYHHFFIFTETRPIVHLT